MAPEGSDCNLAHPDAAHRLCHGSHSFCANLSKELTLKPQISTFQRSKIPTFAVHI
jgi:hypothetical protein